MSWWDVLDVAGHVLFLADAVALVTFVGLYGARSAWHATPAGRVVFGVLAIVAAIMVAAIVLELVGDSSGHIRAMLRVGLYGLLFGGIVHLIIVLLRAQQAAAANDTDEPEPPAAGAP